MRRTFIVPFFLLVALGMIPKFTEVANLFPDNLMLKIAMAVFLAAIIIPMKQASTDLFDI